MALEKPVIQTSGPLFAADVVAKFQREITEGIREIGEEGEGILAGFISNAGFQRSGRFLHSVDTEHINSRGQPGTSIVTVTDDWKHEGAGRPTRTWFERGYRNNVRMRKGNWGFKNTAKRLNQIDLNPFFSERIPRALG